MTILSAIRVEVLETAGLASDDPRFPDATLDRIINRALRSITAEHDWPWNDATETLTTADGTQAYSLHASWSKTKRMRYLARDLIEFQPRDGAQYFNDSGKPFGFFIESEKANFIPTPDAVYSILHVYSKYETTLTSAVAPSLPDRYMDWLVFVSLKQIATRIKDAEMYGMADREQKLWRVRANDEVRRSTGTMTIQTRNDWWI